MCDGGRHRRLWHPLPVLPLLPDLDRATRLFWRLRGRPVDLGGEHEWLSAPMHHGSAVADGWLEHAAEGLGASVARNVPGAGLLSDMAKLDGSTFMSTRPSGRWRRGFSGTPSSSQAVN